MQHHGFYEEGPSTQSSILWTQRNAVMGSFYVPWVGPDKCRVWILICLLVAAVLVCFIYIPVVTCSANDDGGVCAPQVSPQELPGLYTVDVSMLRGCPCNASTVIRSLSNARTLSNTIFANGDVPPLLELRGLSALTVTILPCLAGMAPPTTSCLFPLEIPSLRPPSTLPLATGPQVLMEPAAPIQ